MPQQYPNITPPLFSISDVTNWKTHFEQEGYVVIKNIISDTINEEATSLFKQEWNIVSPNFDWDNTSTWTTTNSPMVWGKSSVVFNGFSQSRFMWLLRTQPSIYEAFSKVYNTSELATSFDGFSVFISPKQKSPNWLHQDQRSDDHQLSIQGLVNLKPVGEYDAGFVCVPKSHLTHIPTASKRDWVMLDKDDPHYQMAGKLIIPKNCLVLWNSKTIHSNTGMNSKHPKKLHHNRLSAYITFVPKSRQTDEIIQERIQGYKAGVSCSHWAARMEVKKLPFHLKKTYLARNFNNIAPVLDENGNIPEKYLKLI